MMLLRFRPLRAGDADYVHELHGDPATNTDNPLGASPDLAASKELLNGWLQHWQLNGFGYELAFDSDRLAGICGARRDIWAGRDVLNLYWRLLPEHWGKGLAISLGQRALAMADTAPNDGALVVARMLPTNVGSRRTAESLGLHRRSDLGGEANGANWIVFAQDEACGTA